MVGRLFTRLGGDPLDIKEIRLYSDEKCIIITKTEMNVFES